MTSTPHPNSADASSKRKNKRIGIVVFSISVLILVGLLLLRFIIPSIAGMINRRVTSDKYLVLTLPDSMTADDITMDQSGTLWFADRSNNKVGKIMLDQKQVTEYALPHAYTKSTAPAITDGNIWFFIIIGPDGNPWFTINGPNGYTIAESTSSGHVTEYTMSSRADTIRGITVGPDGNVWFTAGNKAGFTIRKITPTGHMTEYPIPSKPDEVGGITKGPDGNVWFAEAGAKIGRITPSGAITEFPLTKGNQPGYITTGPDKNIWITTLEKTVIKMAPNGQVVQIYKLPSEASTPANITSGTDGNLWFTESGPEGEYIGRMTPAGTLTQFHEGYGDFQYTSITFHGENLWFAIGFLGSTGKIGRMPVTSQTSPSPSSSR